MPVHIAAPTVIPGVGEKVIRELVGNVNTGTAGAERRQDDEPAAAGRSPRRRPSSTR